MAGDRTRLVLVEDQTIVRQGLKVLFESSGEFEVVGEAETVAGAIEIIEKSQPNVVLLDLKLKEGTGIDVTSQLRQAGNDVPIIVLSVYDDYPMIKAAIDAGISGYLPKNASFGEIETAIRTVLQGESYVHPSITSKLFEGMKKDNSPKHTTELSDEEVQILKLVSQGYRYADIADKLYASERTIRRRMQSIFNKLGVDDRAEAVARAIKEKII